MRRQLAIFIPSLDATMTNLPVLAGGRPTTFEIFEAAPEALQL